MKKQLCNILFFSIIINSNVTLPSLQTHHSAQPNFALTIKFFDAIEKGNIPEVQQLLAEGVSKDIYNNGVGDTALIVATRHQKREMVKFLIEQGFDKNAKNLEGRSPLLIAAQNNDTDGIRDLCCLGTQEVDVHATDSLKNTPLHIVADKDNYMGVFILLKHGKACPYKRNSFGKAPLHIACARGALNAVKSLLTYGDKGQLTTKDNVDRRPLYWAIANENDDVVEKLIQEGALRWENALKYKISEGTLEQFVREGNVKAVQKLFAMGASKDDELLPLAAWYGQVSVLKVLIDAGLKIECRGCLDYTPLHIAARQGHVEALQVLLAAGADKNAQAKDGETALHLAVYNCHHPEVLKVLLDAGADRNIVKNSGITPLTLARYHGYTEAEKLLEEYQPGAAAAAAC